MPPEALPPRGDHRQAARSRGC